MTHELVWAGEKKLSLLQKHKKTLLVFLFGMIFIEIIKYNKFCN